MTVRVERREGVAHVAPHRRCRGRAGGRAGRAERDGVKTIAAYRIGLDFDPTPPDRVVRPSGSHAGADRTHSGTVELAVGRRRLRAPEKSGTLTSRVLDECRIRCYLRWQYSDELLV